jgi:hypothetical protein
MLAWHRPVGFGWSQLSQIVPLLSYTSKHLTGEVVILTDRDYPQQYQVMINTF